MDRGSLADEGLAPQVNVDKMIHTQVAVGNLTASTAPSYAQIVDQSVYADAAKAVAGSG